MKALGKIHDKPGLWLYDAPEPEMGNNDLLIKIDTTAICGTDLHIYNWDAWSQATIPVPMTVGHEFVGRVADMGKDVSGFTLGDRVSGEGHITCGYCRNCRAGKRHLCRNTQGVGVNRTGCFAEYLVLPAGNAYQPPESVTDDVASILDPLGNAAHTALSFDLVGEDVLITGAGPIGIMAAAICRHVGARHVVVTDINDYRLALAQKMGANRVVNVSRMGIDEVTQSLKMKEGFDVGLEMSGVNSAITSLFEAMNHGGKVAMLGIPADTSTIDWKAVIFKGLFIKGIYGREMFETWYKMGTLLQSGLDITPIITHHFNVDDFEEAFRIMNSSEAGKVLLNW